MSRVLLADDETQILRVLRAPLQGSGYEVVTASDGLEAYAAFERENPDLIITDLAMPRMNGLELVTAVRRVSQVPIIVLSVRDTEMMKVKALDSGADDYLTKPFSTPELMARVRAQLRRAQPEGERAEERIEVGDFLIDSEAHSIAVRGQVVHLTPKEFDLLVLLAKMPGKVIAHKVLLRAIWGPAGDEQPEYLRVLIAQLRRKIGMQYIVSEPWVGYRFEPAGSAGAQSLTTS